MIEIQTYENKEDRYRSLLKQLEALLSAEDDTLANQSNACSLIHFSFEHHWTGIYRVQGEELVLGTFQGPPACTRIAYGKGVCGSAWKEEKTIIVPNVHEFEGHIACSSLSNSEIVVPLKRDDGSIWGVFDIDSTEFDNFDHTDAQYLEQIARFLKP
ncbi:MAG: GAF domain-containing protein [Flavobacteriales bacterium]|nr:GAF domain-containing protein [Flavobacteriales bacterium]